eukprot:6190025-Pleurochrysis_carterae.AAC.2
MPSSRCSGCVQWWPVRMAMPSWSRKAERSAACTLSLVKAHSAARGIPSSGSGPYRRRPGTWTNGCTSCRVELGWQRLAWTATMGDDT